MKRVEFLSILSDWVSLLLQLHQCHLSSTFSYQEAGWQFPKLLFCAKFFGTLILVYILHILNDESALFVESYFSNWYDINRIWFLPFFLQFFCWRETEKVRVADRDHHFQIFFSTLFNFNFNFFIFRSSSKPFLI